MTISPLKEEYRVGDSFGVTCATKGQSPSGSRYYACAAGLTWEPQIPEDVQCQEGGSITHLQYMLSVMVNHFCFFYL